MQIQREKEGIYTEAVASRVSTTHAFSYKSAEYFIDSVILFVHHKFGFCLWKLVGKTDSLSV